MLNEILFVNNCNKLTLKAKVLKNNADKKYVRVKKITKTQRSKGQNGIISITRQNVELDIKIIRS